jgi:hypothetical protein
MNFTSLERVLLCVSSGTADPRARLEHLRSDYRRAFENWALHVRRLQTVSQSDSDSLEMKEAEKLAVAAEIAYRGTRDRLADAMLADAKPKLICVSQS